MFIVYMIAHWTIIILKRKLLVLTRNKILQIALDIFKKQRNR